MWPLQKPPAASLAKPVGLPPSLSQLFSLVLLCAEGTFSLLHLICKWTLILCNFRGLNLVVNLKKSKKPLNVAFTSHINNCVSLFLKGDRSTD